MAATQFDYGPAAANALRLICKFGQTVNVTRLEGTYNPATGEVVDQSFEFLYDSLGNQLFDSNGVPLTVPT